MGFWAEGEAQGRILGRKAGRPPGHTDRGRKARAAPRPGVAGRRVFGPCHAVIPPLAFYEGCVFDHCHKTDSNVMCSALELYASLCASRGVCIDWRSHTNHTCRECPPSLGHLVPPYSSRCQRVAGGWARSAGNQQLDFLEEGGRRKGKGVNPRAQCTQLLGRRSWCPASGAQDMQGWGPRVRLPSCRAPAGVRPRVGLGGGSGLVPLASAVASVPTQHSPALRTRCTSPVAPPSPPTAMGVTTPASCMHLPLPPGPAPELPGSASPALGDTGTRPALCCPHRALQDSGPITEGCFCPEGMKLFSRSSEVCVPIDCHSRFPWVGLGADGSTGPRAPQELSLPARSWGFLHGTTCAPKLGPAPGRPGARTVPL